MILRAAASRFVRRPLATLLCVAALTAIATPGSAQTDTGNITGSITDQTGGLLPGVTVTVTNVATGQSRSAVTNDLGRYQVTALQPSRYTVKAELQGFGTLVRSEVTVNLGTTIDVNMTMRLATVQETVTVSGEPPLVESTKSDISSVITHQLLEALPSRSRQYLDYTLLMPATSENTSTSAQGAALNIGGARAAEASLLVDGFYNLDEGFAKVKQRYSEDSIQEFQVTTFGGTAEYGRAIGGIINAVTKSGANAMSGTGYGFMRNENLNSMDFGSKALGLTTKPEFRRQQWGGTLGGPFVADKSFFFGAFERVKEDTPYNDSVTAQNAAAIGLTAADAGNIPQFIRQSFGMGRWDYNFDSDHRLQAAFAISRWTEFNQSAVAFRTLSAEYGLAATDVSYLLKYTGISNGGKKLQEIKVSYFPRYYGVGGRAQGGPPLAAPGQINTGPESNTSPPHVTISSVATFGSAALSNSIDTYPVQAVYSSTRFTDRHTMKFGADYMIAYYNYTLYSPLTGSYSFSSLSNFLAGRYTQYSQSFGEPNNPRWHDYISGYAQDSWQANHRLTVNYGLRYDLELNPKQKASGIPFGNDYNNFGPRAGLSLDLTNKGTTFLKLSSGVYYDRLFQNLSTFFTSLKDHSTLISATWTPTTPGAPVYPNVFAAQPATLPPAVVNTNIMPSPVNVPMSAQALGTLEHAVNPGLVVSGSLVYTRTWDRPYVWDTNLQYNSTTQQWIRIDPSYRQILQYIFAGKAGYLGGIIDVKGHSGRVGFNGNLTLARTRESSSNYSSQPNDQRVGIDADWGPATDTPVVRGVMSGWVNLHPSVQVAASYRARSGIAVNPVAAGLDLIGAGVLGSRTPGFGRNAFRGPENNQLDSRFNWIIPLQGAKKLNVYVECFNGLNHENVLTLNNDYGSNPLTPKASTWLQPTSWAPPREVQLGVRLSF